MGAGRSDGMVSERAQGAGGARWGGAAGVRTHRKEVVFGGGGSQEGGGASGEGCLLGGGGCLTHVFARKGNLSPQSLQAKLPLKQKRKQKANNFHVRREVVLKQKSI